MRAGVTHGDGVKPKDRMTARNYLHIKLRRSRDCFFPLSYLRSFSSSNYAMQINALSI